MPTVDADENAVLKYVKLSEEGKRVSARTAKIPAWIELGNETDFPHKAQSTSLTTGLIRTGTVRVRIVIKNWNPNLITPGFLCSPCGVRGRNAYRAALVPDRVISSQQGLKYVFVVKPDNTGRTS